VWAVEKADIDAGTASVAKALQMGGVVDDSIMTVYKMEEHSTLGMLVMASAPDPEGGAY